MFKININGFVFECQNGNISIHNGKVSLDGKTITIGEGKEINIHGTINRIDTDGNVAVSGNVTGNIDCGGSVNCFDVHGDIDAGGSVVATNVTGSINAGGSVVIKK